MANPCVVYKIKSDAGWYAAHCDFRDNEALSPIFTNRKKAEKKISDEIKINQQRLDTWQKDETAWWVKALANWKTARVISFDLVARRDVQ